MPWVKLRADLVTNPKVVRMACTVGLDEFAIVGRLAAVWAWASESADGTFPGIRPEFIDRLTRCPQFAFAMLAVGWLAWDGEALTFPAWDQHGSPRARSRAGERERRSAHRITARVAPVKTPDTCPARPSESDRSFFETPLVRASEADDRPSGTVRPDPTPEPEKLPDGPQDAARPAPMPDPTRRPVATPPRVAQAARRAGPAKGPSVFDRLPAGALQDPNAVSDWFDWHCRQTEIKRLPHITFNTTDLIRVHAAALYAVEHGQNPLSLFSAIVGRGNFDRIPKRYTEQARVIVAQHLTERRQASASAGHPSGAPQAAVA